MSMLFVYGSLKEGFPNFHVNKGRRLPGSFRTVERHPLWLYKGQLPCLLPASAEGRHVIGQLFEVTAQELAAMDELERVGQPGGYSRHELRVVRIEVAGTEPLTASVYMQDPVLLLEPGSHIGPIAEYTLEHAKRLRW